MIQLKKHQEFILKGTSLQKCQNEYTIFSAVKQVNYTSLILKSAEVKLRRIQNFQIEFKGRKQ